MRKTLVPSLRRAHRRPARPGMARPSACRPKNAPAQVRSHG